MIKWLKRLWGTITPIPKNTREIEKEIADRVTKKILSRDRD